jgi:hypothetical protein
LSARIFGCESLLNRIKEVKYQTHLPLRHTVLRDRYILLSYSFSFERCCHHHNTPNHDDIVRLYYLASLQREESPTRYPFSEEDMHKFEASMEANAKTSRWLGWRAILILIVLSLGISSLSLLSLISVSRAGRKFFFGHPFLSFFSVMIIDISFISYLYMYLIDM